MREDGTIDAADVDILSTSELSAVLAAAEGIEVASVERGAEELEIAPPSEATVHEEYVDRNGTVEEAVSHSPLCRAPAAAIAPSSSISAAPTRLSASKR